MEASTLNAKFHILAFNLAVFAKEEPRTVARSGTNSACLPALRDYQARFPLPENDDEIIRHSYYNHQWQTEWRSNSSARRKQFSLFHSISQFLSAGQTQGFETALILRSTAATPSMSAAVTELNALIPYVHPGQLATIDSYSSDTVTRGNDGTYGGRTSVGVPSRRASILARLTDIVRTIPTFQFPIGADGSLRWFFRMPDQATQHPAEPPEDQTLQHDQEL